MATILTGILSLRGDPRLVKLPPYLSALLVIVGIGWLAILPLDEYSRKTYISENALLPGQVHTYFGGSEHNVFRAYRQEVAALAELSTDDRNAGLLEILTSQSLKATTQDYHFSRAGEWRNGTNVYGVIQAPRGDATEAMVLIGAWKNMDDATNYSGVALVLTLARYFKRWSLWSKDIIILITPDSTFGPQAWVDAYHEAHDTSAVSPLSIKSGALQGAVAVDYPANQWGHRFDKLHVVYDGVNGQSPNLDLINSVVNIANGQIGMPCAIQRLFKFEGSYEERLLTILRSMLSQAVGQSSGPHSSFIPYHVDAVTLQTVGDGWHDEMSLGKVVEGTFRSLNNLLEHLHQSFFFYLLLHPLRFVSIGTYLPGAMLIAGNFTISAILLWFISGRPILKTNSTKQPSALDKNEPVTLLKKDNSVAVIPSQELQIAERELLLPLIVVGGAHVAGLIPLYLLTNGAEEMMETLGMALAITSALLPLIAAVASARVLKMNRQQLMMVQSLSLLVLGGALSTLATINFAQAFFVGLAATPLSFLRPIYEGVSPSLRKKLTLVVTLLLIAVSPMTIITAAGAQWQLPLGKMLTGAAWAWQVEGVWTGFTVWLVWWPAWACGVFAFSSGALQQ